MSRHFLKYILNIIYPNNALSRHLLMRKKTKKQDASEIPYGHKIDKISVGKLKYHGEGIHTITIMIVQLHPHIQAGANWDPLTFR